MAAPFWVNSLDDATGVVAALIWWRPSTEGKSTRLPPEPLLRAVGSGLRHARHNVHLRATLIRAFAFFIFASSYWAVLPLIARNQVAGGPALYGLLLAAIGVGAVSAAFTLPALKQRLGADRLAAAGTLGTALALVLFAAARDPITALAASLIAGIAWITALATINVSAQMALPPWVRGRGLSIYVAVMFGGMSLGSVIWGKAAAFTGHATGRVHDRRGRSSAQRANPDALEAANGGYARSHAVDALAGTNCFKQKSILTGAPVMVTVEYRINPTGSDGLSGGPCQARGRKRRRDGAFDWGVFEDAAQDGRFVETFLLDSWLEHLRQHERVSNTDRELQDIVHGFHPDGTPRVTHLIAAQPR